MEISVVLILLGARGTLLKTLKLENELKLFKLDGSSGIWENTEEGAGNCEIHLAYSAYASECLK